MLIAWLCLTLSYEIDVYQGGHSLVAYIYFCGRAFLVAHCQNLLESWTYEASMAFISKNTYSSHIESEFHQDDHRKAMAALEAAIGFECGDDDIFFPAGNDTKTNSEEVKGNKLTAIQVANALSNRRKAWAADVIQDWVVNTEDCVASNSCWWIVQHLWEACTINVSSDPRIRFLSEGKA